MGYAIPQQTYPNHAMMPGTGYAVPPQYQYQVMPPNQVPYLQQQGQSPLMRQQGQHFMQPTQPTNQTPQQYPNQAFFQQQYLPQNMPPQQMMQQQQLLSQSTNAIPGYAATVTQQSVFVRQASPQLQQRNSSPHLQQRNNSPLYQPVQPEMIRQPHPQSIAQQQQPQYHLPPQSQPLSKLQKLQQQQHLTLRLQEQPILQNPHRQQQQPVATNTQPIPTQILPQNQNHLPNQYPQQQQPPIMMSYHPNQYGMYPMQYVQPTPQNAGLPPQPFMNYAYGHVPPQTNKTSSTVVSPQQLHYSQMMPPAAAATRTLDGRPVTINTTIMNQLIQNNPQQPQPSTSQQSYIQHQHFPSPFSENNLSANPFNRISKINLQSNISTVEKRVRRRRRRQEELLLVDEDAEDWRPPVKHQKRYDRSPSLSSSAETSYASDSSMSSSLPLAHLLEPQQVAPKTRFFLMKKFKHLVKDCSVKLRRLSRKDISVLKASLKLSHPVNLTEVSDCEQNTNFYRLTKNEIFRIIFATKVLGHQ
jgi:hypothetical protein